MFLRLRSSIFFVWMTLLAIFFALTGWITILLPYRARYWYIGRWSYIVTASARTICGIHFKVKGLKNIPKKPCILALNHQSAWETIALQVIAPPQTWLLKRELLWVPFFGWGLALLRPIAINRAKSGGLKRLLVLGAKRLKQGLFIVIFPEGTRHPVGKLGPLRRSAALLSQNTRVPMVPIAHNAGSCWPKNSFVKRPGMIEVVIGAPIFPEDKSLDVLMAELEHALKSQMESIEVQKN